MTNPRPRTSHEEYEDARREYLDALQHLARLEVAGAPAEQITEAKTVRDKALARLGSLNWHPPSNEPGS